MRITTVPLALAALFGVVGAGIATVVHFASAHSAIGGGDFGFYAYSSMPRRYADYLPTTAFGAGRQIYPSWLPMLPAGVGAGVVAGLLIGVLFARSGLRVVRRTTEDAA